MGDGVRREMWLSREVGRVVRVLGANVLKLQTLSAMIGIRQTLSGELPRWAKLDRTGAFAAGSGG